MNPDNIVNKALSPEEEGMISNIMSMCNELLASGKAQEEQPAITEPETATMQEGAPPVAEPDDKKEKEEKTKMTLVVKALSQVMKELVDTSSEGPTGSDDAEERIEGVLDDITEQNLGQVTKSITNILKNQKVQKSAAAQATASNSLVVKALNDIANVVKANQERQNSLEKALNGILEGMGVMEQIEVINKSQEQPGVTDNNVNKGGQPVMANQNQEVLNFLQQLGANVNKSETNNDFGAHVDRKNSIHKTLSDKTFIGGLIGRRI